MVDQTFLDEIDARIEAALAKRKVDLAQLPIIALSRKLAQAGPAEPLEGRELAKGSIGPDRLDRPFVEGKSTQSNWRVHGQYVVAFNLAAGVASTTTVTTDALGTSWVPFGAPSYTGAIAWQDRITWGYKALTATSLEIALANNGSGTAVGNFNFFVLSVA